MELGFLTPPPTLGPMRDISAFTEYEKSGLAHFRIADEPRTNKKMEEKNLFSSLIQPPPMPKDIPVAAVLVTMPFMNVANVTLTFP